MKNTVLDFEDRCNIYLLCYHGLHRMAEKCICPGFVHVVVGNPALLLR
jgi:hypothetical protein